MAKYRGCAKADTFALSLLGPHRAAARRCRIEPPQVGELVDMCPGRTVDGIDIDPAHLITMLPVSVSSLLQGRELVSPLDWEQDCIAQTTEETRVLERVLREAGHARDAFINRFMIPYSVDIPGAYGMEVWFMLEPRFPDGSIGCSACG